MNTRLTEKEVDESKKSTMAYEDVRWKWGLLNGNSLLRNTKESFRRLTSQPYFSLFSERASRKSVYGAMSQNGITGNDSFTVTVGARTLRVPVSPNDTLQSIADWINKPFLDPANLPSGFSPEDHGFVYAYEEYEKKNLYLNPLFYDPEGRRYPIPFINARVVDNKLELSKGDGEVDRPVRLGGSNAVLSALGLNYEYTTLSQVGIALPSTGGTLTDAAKNGELEFDTSKFMKAIEANPDDVALVFNSFAGQMQTYLDDMVKTSQKEVAGTVMVQGSVAREMNHIDDQIRSIDRYLTDFERRLQTKQQSLFDQFSRAEVAMGKLLQQASWLASVTQQLQSGNFG
jgi:flagellar capping protein FliD